MQKLFKLPKAVSLLLLLSFILVVGCDSDNGGDSDFQFCTVEEIEEQFATTDCIAEEFTMGCSNVECDNRANSGIGIKEISFGGASNCTVLDCETMECELRVSGESLLGFVAELKIGEMSGLPTGVFRVENQESAFVCFVVLP